ncbi:Ig-like domain repeat protein [Terrabacter sp. 2RAF25]|uniref:Ig-like domain-containing protein n=1 Tax=Terrabacter sp. 2RAF25 TaxID=3232998 RepID=UPI003F9BBA8E
MLRATLRHRRERRAAPSRGVRALRVGVLFLALMTISAPSYAFWTQAAVAAASGTGSGSTSTLSAPTAVNASVPNGGTSVSLTWSAPTTGVSPGGYRVIRTDTATSSAVAACGTSATSPVTTTSCVDGAVPDGTYRYTVVALRSGWTATSADSNSVTVLQIIATTTALTTSASPSLVGQPVTFTATVAAASGAPSGLVAFRSGGSAISCSGGSQTLSSGVATCVTTFGSTGTRSITAVYAGSAPFAASTSSALSQVVNQQTQTITFTSSAPTSETVGGPTYAVAASATSSLPVTFTSGTSAVCSVNGSTVTFVGSGTCTVLADQAGNAAYAPATQATQSFTVAKASQAITITSAAPTNATRGGTYTVAATATSGLAVTFSSATSSVCTVSGSTVTFVGAGTCTIQADQPGNGTYAAAAQKLQSFQVVKAAQSITITSTAPTSAAAGGAIYTVTASSTSGLPVSISSGTTSVCTVSGSTVTFVGGGTCVVLADQPGDAAYAPAAQKSQSFAVTVTPTTPTMLVVVPIPGGVTATWVPVAGLTYECQVTNGASPPGATSWTACSSGVTVTGTKNGTSTFYVRSVRGGVASTPASASFSGI